MGLNRLVGAPYQQEEVTESFDTTFGVDLYLVKAAIGSPVTVTLDPTAVQGDRVAVQDAGNNAASQAITIEVSPGQTILGGATSLTISIDGAGFQLTFNQATRSWTPQALSATGSGGASAEQDHLIDHVDTEAVESSGSGAVVVIGSNNTVVLALSPGIEDSGDFAYGVYEGVPGIIRTTGVVPDIQVDPSSPSPVADDSLYVSGVTAGTVSTVQNDRNQVAIGTVVDASMYSVSNRRVKAFIVPPQNGV